MTPGKWTSNEDYYEVVTVNISKTDLKVIFMLCQKGEYPSRSEAMRSLVNMGLAQKLKELQLKEDYIEPHEDLEDSNILIIDGIRKQVIRRLE